MNEVETTLTVHAILIQTCPPRTGTYLQQLLRYTKMAGITSLTNIEMTRKYINLRTDPLQGEEGSGHMPPFELSPGQNVDLANQKINVDCQ